MQSGERERQHGAQTFDNKLSRAIRTKDSATIATRDEARRYMAALPDRRALYQAWQHAARLLLDGADVNN